MWPCLPIHCLSCSSAWVFRASSSRSSRRAFVLNASGSSIFSEASLDKVKFKLSNSWYTSPVMTQFLRSNQFTMTREFNWQSKLTQTTFLLGCSLNYDTVVTRAYLIVPALCNILSEKRLVEVNEIKLERARSCERKNPRTTLEIYFVIQRESFDECATKYFVLIFVAAWLWHLLLLGSAVIVIA